MRVSRVSMVSETESSEDEQHKRKMTWGERGEERTKGETRKLQKEMSHRKTNMSFLQAIVSVSVVFHLTLCHDKSSCAK